MCLEDCLSLYVTRHMPGHNMFFCLFCFPNEADHMWIYFLWAKYILFPTIIYFLFLFWRILGLINFYWASGTVLSFASVSTTCRCRRPEPSQDDLVEQIKHQEAWLIEPIWWKVSMLQDISSGHHYQCQQHDLLNLCTFVIVWWPDVGKVYPGAVPILPMILHNLTNSYF